MCSDRRRRTAACARPPPGRRAARRSRWCRSCAAPVWPSRPLSVPAASSVVPAAARHGAAQRDRGAGGRIDLLAVVHLDDLGIVLLGRQGGGHALGQRQEQVHPGGEIGGVDDRRCARAALPPPPPARPTGRRCRAPGLAGGGRGLGMGDRGRGMGEVDHHVAGGEQRGDVGQDRRRRRRRRRPGGRCRRPASAPAASTSSTSRRPMRPAMPAMPMRMGMRVSPRRMRRSSWPGAAAPASPPPLVGRVRATQGAAR